MAGSVLTTMELDMKERKPLSFEDSFDDDFWMEVEKKKQEKEPRSFQAEEAFQRVRAIRLKNKFTFEDGNDIDPLVRIMQRSHELLNSEDASEKLKSKKESTKLILELLHEDYERCKSDRVVSDYADLIADGSETSKTIAHIFFEVRYYEVVLESLKLYPDLKYIRTRGENCLLLKEMIHASEHRGDVDYSNCYYERLSDELGFSNYELLDEIWQRQPARKILLKKGVISSVGSFLSNVCRRSSGRTSVTTNTKSVSPIIANLDGNSNGSKHVFILSAEKTQRRLVQRLCSKLEVISQGDLRISDTESCIRSESSDDLTTVIGSSRTLIVLFSKALKLLLSNTCVPHDAILPEDVGQELMKYLQSDRQEQLLIALRKNNNDEDEADGIDVYLQNYVSVELNATDWKLTSRQMEGLGRRIHALMS